MLMLAKAVGGTRVYIPGRVEERHWLAQVIGLHSAKKLVDHFKGYSFTKTEQLSERGDFHQIPLAPRESVTDNGLSARAAALHCGVTMRTIHRRRAKSRKAGKR